MHNQPAAQIKHPDMETKKKPFRKWSYGHFKLSLGNTSVLLSLVPTIKHLRGTQDLVGWVGVALAPLTSKCPRWRRAAERLAKHTDTSGLPGSSWDAACKDQRTAAASGDPSQDPLSRVPSSGMPSRELLLAPHRSPSTMRSCRTLPWGSPEGIPLAGRCCGTPLLQYLPWSRASGQPGTGPA